MEKELCCNCNEETGRAGKYDDSLFLDNGEGPFCERCYDKHRVEELELLLNNVDGITELKKAARSALIAIECLIDEKKMLAAKMTGHTTLGNIRAELNCALKNIDDWS